MERRYEVTDENNFYYMMAGRFISESDKIVTLEFDLDQKQGGLQRVQFYNHQVRYFGYY